MIDTKEAAARIAFAELEARQQRARAETRAQRWRLARTVFRVLLAIGAGVYLQVSHWQISGAQACGLFLLYLAATAWAEHQMAETIQTLRAEVERLKCEVARKSG